MTAQRQTVAAVYRSTGTELFSTSGPFGVPSSSARSLTCRAGRGGATPTPAITTATGAPERGGCGSVAGLAALGRVAEGGAPHATRPAPATPALDRPPFLGGALDGVAAGGPSSSAWCSWTLFASTTSSTTTRGTPLAVWLARPGPPSRPPSQTLGGAGGRGPAGPGHAAEALSGLVWGAW